MQWIQAFCFAAEHLPPPPPKKKSNKNKEKTNMQKQQQQQNKQTKHNNNNKTDHNDLSVCLFLQCPSPIQNEHNTVKSENKYHWYVDVLVRVIYEKCLSFRETIALEISKLTQTYL